MRIKKTIRQFDHLILLLGLLGLIALPIFAEDSNNSSVFHQGLMLLVITAGVSMTYSHDAISSTWSLIIGQFVWGITLVEIAWGFDGQLFKILSVLQVIYFAVLLWQVFRLILKVKEVDSKMLIYALSGYILLGMIWAVLVSIWLATHPGSFSFASGIREGIDNENYFTFVTMSTLGYGDMLPLSEGAKSFSILISVTGAFYMTMVMGIIVGKYVSLLSSKEK